MARVIFLLMTIVVNYTAFAADTPLPKGTFDNSACIQCHEKNNPELIKAWRNSAHSNPKNTADCVGCHGKQHEDPLADARNDTVCIGCHGGKKSPVVHSYTTSKHGVIMKLEHKSYDWSLKLQQANYRVPGCAYCHMHTGEHNVSLSVRKWTTLENTTASERTQIHNITSTSCRECHSPRYVQELLENGERMLDIARMKVREAHNLLQDAKKLYTDEALAEAQQHFEKMQHHLRNVYYGIGHQSPDYQWWHGQPALDGDLLRIKGFVSDLDRSAQMK